MHRLARSGTKSEFQVVVGIGPFATAQHGVKGALEGYRSRVRLLTRAGRDYGVGLRNFVDGVKYEG